MSHPPPPRLLLLAAGPPITHRPPPTAVAGGWRARCRTARNARRVRSTCAWGVGPSLSRASPTAAYARTSPSRAKAMGAPRRSGPATWHLPPPGCPTRHRRGFGCSVRASASSASVWDRLVGLPPQRQRGRCRRRPTRLILARGPWTRTTIKPTPSWNLPKRWRSRSSAASGAASPSVASPASAGAITGTRAEAKPSPARRGPGVTTFGCPEPLQKRSLRSGSGFPSSIRKSAPRASAQARRPTRGPKKQQVRRQQRPPPGISSPNHKAT